jgi:hypothetical protein
MSEPTIDEMLAWLTLAENFAAGKGEITKAIRAILERHKFVTLFDDARQLEAIRAFVERVEKRLPDYNTGKGADSWLKAYRLAVFDELAAIEKDAEISRTEETK